MKKVTIIQKNHKTMKEEQYFGSQALLKEMYLYLSAEMILLRKVIESKKLKDRSQIIIAMIASLLGTGNAILLLAEENQRFYNEQIMLARGFFERITNICYLLLCSEDTFIKCMKHAVYKQYVGSRYNKKVIKDEEDNILMEIELKRKINEKLEKNPLVKEAIKEFEEKDKKNKNFPVPKIEKRLGLLVKQSKLLNTSLFLTYQQNYYSDASEALHGSFYGSLFHILNIGAKRKEEIEREVNKNTTLLLWQTGTLFDQLIILLHEKCNIQNFFEESVENNKLALEKMKKALQ